MSDEGDKEYDQGYEDGYHNAANAAMTRVHAVDRLESQNQALQEALRNIADICHGWAGPEAAASNAMRLASVAAFARNALSPTQETDPE